MDGRNWNRRKRTILLYLTLCQYATGAKWRAWTTTRGYTLARQARAGGAGGGRIGRARRAFASRDDQVRTADPPGREGYHYGAPKPKGEGALLAVAAAE